MFRKVLGFSLLSLLCGLLIACVLALGSIISYRSIIDKYRVAAITNRLVAVLRFAQSIAIASNEKIRLCPLGADRVSCGSDWGRGQLLLRESDHQVLRMLPAIPANYNFIWRSRLGLNQSILWRGNGFTDGEQGSFWLCRNAGRYQSHGRQIVLLATGSVRVVNGCQAHSELNTQ